ncbi:MAG: tetratricopeptide repeat protein, partial [Chromatiaceae bacterium]
YADARPMLEALLPVQPDNLDVLYNLGMVYSDEGRLEEARSLLRRATKMAPEHANAFVALGVAALRARDTDEAEGALTRAVELEPQNPYALRTLGTLRLSKGDASGAVGLLRQAVTQAPGDPIALLTLAQALIKTDLASHGSEADGLLKRVLTLAPHGEIAEKAKDERRRIAEQGFRERGGDGLRMDAVMYCLDALTKFEGMSRLELAPILMELAALGQKGLPVNDPTQTFRLHSLAGEFTALQVLCFMHVGIKQIDPGQGSGFDIDKEYETAVAMHGGGQTEP